MSLATLSRRGLFVLASVLALGHGSPAISGEPRYWIIVHPDNPADTLRREEVSRLFLKKMTRWADGRTAAPVDLVESSPARDAFTRDIHKRPISAIKKYWQQKVFSGEAAPPPEAASEEDVLAQVRADPHAVGYVSDEAVLRGVKILDLVDPPAAARTAAKRTAAPSR